MFAEHLGMQFAQTAIDTIPKACKGRQIRRLSQHRNIAMQTGKGFNPGL